VFDEAMIAQSQAAINTYGPHPVLFEFNVAALLQITAAVQLAMRHPELPTRAQQHLERFVQNVRLAVGRMSPDLASVVDLGSRPGPMGFVEFDTASKPAKG